MISDGNATVMVSDMNRAVEFYTSTLGLTLEYRAGDHWAQVRAGKFVIGLHPAGNHPGLAGSRGAISIGLTVTESIDLVVQRLRDKGVVFDGPVKNDGAVRLAFFGDPDGNELYLCEVKHG
jgi:catechol 2,3-dioxygenase-like lactoylglutathione lyase family enzyme